MSNPVVKLTGLTRSFEQGGVTIDVLRGVNLAIQPGEIVALIGANGAGKTTSMRAITGLKTILSGEIWFDGARIDGLSADQIVQRGIAMVPEGRHVFPFMSVRDNLLMGAFLRRDKAAVKDDLERMLTRFPRLRERWKADGCTPGDMMLERRKIPLDEEKEEVIPPTINGKWTGTLSQSDRDYGFYFEADLHEGRRGQSYIVSEDNGGSAFHKLEWRYDSIFQLLSFKELEVASKTDPRWQWCIKSGTLSFRREASRLVLEGDWNGFIEGYDLDTGPCANGSVYLEKPILTRRIVQKQSMLQQPYEAESKRTIKVERVLEVQSSSIKIKVWDNGTVDGDVATLFLNGERILNEFRVDKRKFGIPVKLNQNDNFLVLHAESLGDISPNTVAISVDDGVKEQIIILSSNLNESGAVMIRKFQVSN